MALCGVPSAEALEVPVTFFVSTGTLGSRREFWWDELERCLEVAPPGAPSFALRPAGGAEEVFPAATREERAALYRTLHPRLKLMTLEARDQTLAALRAWAGTSDTGRESHRPLAIDELRTYQRALSPGEVWQLYAAQLVRSETELLGHGT